MTDSTLNLEFHNRQQAWALINTQLFPFLKQWLTDGRKLVMVISLRKRTKPQNSRYWGKGVLTQISQQATVGGKLFSAETWHEQFKRQFIGVIELPDGSVLGKSSTDLDTAEFSLFCTQVEAYACTDLGVTFYELQPA